MSYFVQLGYLHVFRQFVYHEMDWCIENLYICTNLPRNFYRYITWCISLIHFPLSNIYIKGKNILPVFKYIQYCYNVLYSTQSKLSYAQSVMTYKKLSFWGEMGILKTVDSLVYIHLGKRVSILRNTQPPLSILYT